MRALLVLLVFQACGASGQCTRESCAALTPSTSYLLYDVNHGEGFNLRRDVYIRMANLVHSLRERTSSDANWLLVLPPWGPLYHWSSYNLPRTKIPWSTFFDLESLGRFVPVVEFHELLRPSTLTIPYAFTLQHFSEGWGEHFEEKLEVRPCIDEASYEKEDDRYYHGWFFGYNDRVRVKQFNCLAAQGFVTVLADYVIKNLTWPLETTSEASVRAVMFDRAETLLHADYGGYNYWRARRSMRYAKRLINLGNRFRAERLNSTDGADHTVLVDDWTKMQRHRGQALGGPYLGVHLRRRDYVEARPGHVPTLEHAARQVCDHLQRLNLSLVFIASDADEHEIDQLRGHAAKICELAAEQLLSYRPSEKVLEKILDGGKAIVDQWICAHARYFIGSYESTFSFRIQEEREIFGFEQSTTFNRLCGDQEGMTCEKPTVWSIVY